MTTSLGLFFLKADKLHSKSQKEKKSNLRRTNFPQKCFCVREKKLHVCQKIYNNNFLGKYAKNNSLWIFHFFPQNDVVHMQKAVMTTVPSFFHHKARNISLKVQERWKTSEKWKKKNKFFQKNTSGHFGMSLDNRAEIVFA